MSAMSSNAVAEMARYTSRLKLRASAWDATSAAAAASSSTATSAATTGQE